MGEPNVIMDSKDDPVSLDNTGVVSQAVSSSENKDDVESCIKEVLEKNKESDQPQLDKDSTQSCTEIVLEENKESDQPQLDKDSTQSCTEIVLEKNKESDQSQFNKDNTENNVQEVLEENKESDEPQFDKDNTENSVQEVLEENKESDEPQFDKDNTENSVQEVLEENKESDQPQFDKDNTENSVQEVLEENKESDQPQFDKDNIESCSQEVSEENKESDQSQFDKNITKVQDEMDKEETTIAYEKSIVSNNIEKVDASDSTVCLQTIEGDNNAGIEVALTENDNETVTTEGNNVVEHSCKENTSTVHADVETAELDISNLTKNCEFSSTLENSCEIEDNTVNDSAKSTYDNVANESEMLSKEKTKDCDIPDELSINADDVQISQKEATLLKRMELESSDSNLDNSEKDQSEKNIEPEKTEFIQFSHDKHDDSQIEGQPIEAEDPFGGDNFTSENVEQVETDSLAENELSFKKLYEQGDNLQDAVNARNNDCNEKLNVDFALNDPKNADVDKIVDNVTETSNRQTTINSHENTSMDIDLPGTKTLETRAENMSITKSPTEQDEQAKKNVGEITSMRADEETDVLPGQDDELCIIPDSMKVIIPNKPGKTIDDNQSESALAKDSKCEEAQKCGKSNAELEKNISQDQSKLVTINENKAENIVKQKAIVQDESATKNLTPTTDVINIDDEKNSEVEEISNKEVCKQCGEERACKIRVKVGIENYLVCSKTCKALFKAANNKVIDIPSEGATSKREKRCATCLLIIEANDERNLSWETMEFCNEECLGKFQRKYGSFCKNCNGAVQAVSLGKYCVRFGCDVRQFCCSTCLEEFKKGLKVCSYCQKDISFSTDGFLAPVGEKGQFKDFCTQDCMEKYSKLNSTEPPATETKPCSVCQQVKQFF